MGSKNQNWRLVPGDPKNTGHGEIARLITDDPHMYIVICPKSFYVHTRIKSEGAKVTEEMLKDIELARSCYNVGKHIGDENKKK